MIVNIFLFVLWFVMWLALSWPADARQIIIGIPVSIFVSLMTADFFAKPSNAFRNPLRYLWLVYYALIFLWECVKANIDVAWRVIHPNLPIRPAMIKVKTKLRSDTALTFLANSVTLSPGTTTVDIDKDRGFLYIHLLNMNEGYDKSSMRLGLVEKFENILARVFD